MHAQNNYDPVAGYYDFISKLIFGRAEKNAQIRLLLDLSPGDRVLIIGGGTGWILEEMTAIQSSGLQITYVENSRKMMAKAVQRATGKNKVSFVLAPVESFHTAEKYDYILTGFFFDNFSTEYSSSIIRHLDQMLRSKGFWCFADFQYSKDSSPLWQHLLLQSMYIAARFICNVQATRLPDTKQLFLAAGYNIRHAENFYYGMISSIVYQKADSPTL